MQLSVKSVVIIIMITIIIIATTMRMYNNNNRKSNNNEKTCLELGAEIFQSQMGKSTAWQK